MLAAIASAAPPRERQGHDVRHHHADEKAKYRKQGHQNEKRTNGRRVDVVRHQRHIGQHDTHAIEVKRTPRAAGDDIAGAIRCVARVLARDVAAVVADAGINVTSVTSSTNTSSQKAVITAILEIEAVDQIDRIFKRLRQVKNVVSVHRAPSTKATASRRIE